MGLFGHGAAVAIGANCTFRRAALLSIGGHGVGLAEDLVTAIRLHARGWRSIYLPEIVSRGFNVGEGAEFMDKARQVVARTLEGSNDEEKTDWGVMKEKIRADLKRHIVKETSRRPLIMPVILEV